MNPFIHFNAKTVDDAILKLTEHKQSKVIAGGTDCLGVLKDRLLPTYPEVLVNIKTIPGLDAIEEDDEGLKIGALTKLSDIAESPIVNERYGILADAAKSVATPQIRGMATIGGNLCQDVRCWYYRHPHQVGGRILCLRKGAKICNALAGDNRYHSIFGGAPVAGDSCSTGCPAETNIPLCLSKVRNGEFMEAARVWLVSNPIPAITGRVCRTFCEPECNRGEFDEPVAIRCIERALGDHILGKMTEVFTPPETESGRNIAIVGSGPAGLVAAYYLRSSGHQVTVFERLKEAGGMLLYSIPPYRLPKDVVRKQIQALESMGIKFEVGVNVGQDVTVTELMDRFDAVFLAVGAWKERPLGIKGEQVALSGLEFLNNVNTGARDLPGRRVAVIGGGNVAFDCGRTALRLGGQEVHMFCMEDRESMPADPAEVKKGIEEGIEIEFLTLPTEASEAKGKITVKWVRIKLGAPDASGWPQPIPIPGSDFTATFDAVIKAIGEEPDTSLLPAEFQQKTMKAGPSAYRLGKNLFAGGDFTTGRSTVVQAVASGREAVSLIEQSFKAGQPSAEVGGTEPGFRSPSIEEVPRVRIPELPVWERVKSIDVEDILDLSLSEIEIEAGRCFDCGCLAVSPSDIGMVLLALDAKIVTTKRTVDAKNFFAGNGSGPTVLAPDELVTEIQVPKPPEGTKQTFRKFRLRKAIDFAIVSVASAITIEGGVCKDARIALGAVAPTPIRATEAEEAIKGKPVSTATAEEAAKAAVAGAAPFTMNAYKVEITKALVKRAILT